MREPEVSVVIPARNEAGNLEALYDRVMAMLRQAKVSYELLFVDDGSTDRTLELIKELRARDGTVRYLSLSRSFGHQAALFAGLCAARGRAVIMMDADLQHPPELLPEMIRLWREGYEVVYTTKRQQALPWWWRWQMQIFYAVVSKLCGLQLSLGQSDYRLLDRQVADVLRSMPEYRKFLRGLVNWVGFRQHGLEYTLPARQQGRSQYIYRARLELALDGIFAFSVVPLRLLLLFGLIVATLTFPYIVVIVVLGIGRWLGSPVYLLPGWATVAVSVLWLGSIQLIAIGILGEYIARIYDQTKARPAFIIREASDAGASSTMASSMLVEEA